MPGGLFSVPQEKLEFKSLVCLAYCRWSVIYDQPPVSSSNCEWKVRNHTLSLNKMYLIRSAYFDTPASVSRLYPSNVAKRR